MSKTQIDKSLIVPVRRTWVEVDLDKILANFRSIRGSISADCKVIAVVKANAYGHGMVPVARTLAQAGTNHFAVATVDEAIELRQALPSPEILVLEGFQMGNGIAFEAFRLTATYTGNQKPPKSVPAHLKIDTGMTRQGVPFWREDQVQQAFTELGDQLTGVYSHFCTADDDQDFAAIQLHRFCDATKQCNVMRHISSSYSLPNKATHFDAVRPGLALYGLGPKALVGLQPALQWKGRLLEVKTVPRGSTVGYGRTYKTQKKETKIGVVSAGYGDGYSRLFSNNGYMQFQGCLAPIVGRVSMDMSTIDLTDAPTANVGDEVILLSDVITSPVSAENLAKQIGTIPYEVFTFISNRVTTLHTGGSVSADINPNSAVENCYGGG
jgi:alanine racemase